MSRFGLRKTVFIVQTSIQLPRQVLRLHCNVTMLNFKSRRRRSRFNHESAVAFYLQDQNPGVNKIEDVTSPSALL